VIFSVGINGPFDSAQGPPLRLRSGTALATILMGTRWLSGGDRWLSGVEATTKVPSTPLRDRPCDSALRQAQQPLRDRTCDYSHVNPVAERRRSVAERSRSHLQGPFDSAQGPTAPTPSACAFSRCGNTASRL
jgi:hypothetical protein